MFDDGDDASGGGGGLLQLLPPPLPLFPASLIPTSMPLTRLRHIIHVIVGCNKASVASLWLRRIDVLSVSIWLISFVISSLPRYRERAQGVFLPGGKEVSAAANTIQGYAFSFFFLLFLCQLFTVTAIPDAAETAALTLVALGRNGIRENEPLFSSSSSSSSSSKISRSQEEPYSRRYNDDTRTAAAAAAGMTDDLDAVKRINHAIWTPVLCMRRIDNPKPGAFDEMKHYRRHQVFQRGFARIISFLLTSWSILDMIAISSVLAEAVSPRGALPPFFASLRFIRLARLVRGMEDSVSFRVLRRSASKTFVALGASFLPMASLCAVSFACVLYLCERGEWNEEMGAWVRPDFKGLATEISPFESVLSALWWAVVTLSSTGYGDLVPTTADGRVAATFAIFCALLIVAAPAAVMGLNFTHEYAAIERRETARIDLASEKRRWEAHVAPGGPIDRAIDAAVARAFLKHATHAQK